MRNSRTKITFRKVAESRPFLIFLGTVVLMFSWSVFKFWNKLEETERNKEIVEAKAVAMREKKAKLEEDIERLNTVEGKEEFFRENYGLAKEGEEVIVVVEDKNATGPSQAPKKKGFWDFLSRLFK